MTNWTMLVALIALAAMLGRSVVAQKDGLTKRPNPIYLASDDAKEILLVMDTDKQGKITKEAWMKFMATEFDRMDADGSGTIDPQNLQLAKRPPGPKRFSDLGK